MVHFQGSLFEPYVPGRSFEGITVDETQLLIEPAQVEFVFFAEAENLILFSVAIGGVIDCGVDKSVFSFPKYVIKTQSPRIDLNKRFLPRPNITTA